MKRGLVKYLKSLLIILSILPERVQHNDDSEIKGIVCAFDSSSIDLCLSVFWWAKFRKAKGGIKLHTLFDITTQIPAFVHITSANVSDVKAIGLSQL